jgi:hypothetical protein
MAGDLATRSLGGSAKRASICVVNETMKTTKEVDNEGNGFDDDNFEDIEMEYMIVVAGTAGVL